MINGTVTISFFFFFCSIYTIKMFILFAKTSLIDRLGRRPLLISTMSIIAILLLILTLCTHLQVRTQIYQPANGSTRLFSGIYC